MANYPGRKKAQSSGGNNVSQIGIPGPQGPPGTPGPQNLFIQETQPTETTPYVWFQTDALGNLITLWVNTQ